MHAMTGDKLKITTLNSSSVAAIHALWRRAALSIRPQGRDDPGRLRRVIDSGTETFFGIHEGGDLIAVILATHDGRKGWLNRLAVDPAHRRRGLAAALIRRAEQYLRAQGIEIIGVLIEDGNQESMRLFRKCGYILHDDIHYLTKRDHPGV